MDAGPVYRQKIIDIAVDEVAGELLTRLSHVAAQELVSTLTDITNGLQPVPQSDVGVTFAPKLKVEEVRLNLREPAERIRGLIRGANPNPGAWCEFRNSRLKVLRTEQQSIDCYQAALALVMPVADLKRLMAPGVLFPSKRTLLVCCGDARFLALSELQANGKRPLPGAEWARGARVQPGERLA
jgi:methionyl-tRNA formyltransferase